MKKFISSLAVALAATATLHAGTSYETTSSDRPGSESGRGFYVGAQGGFNLYQSTDNESSYGVKISSKSEVGGFGGLKFGYVWGSALEVVRPALELDGFYNGFSQSATAEYLGYKFGDTKLKVDSGAFLANGIARFALGSFQPYIGAGVGVYNADESVTIDDFDIKVDGFVHRIKGTKDTTNRTNFAWQILAGVDYYITSDVSVFTEYKFLNYMDSGDRLGQQLVGAGVRFHF